MAIEEKEQKETILDELIEKVEKDPIPTNIFTTEDTDPLVLLGKLNEVIAHLKALRLLIGESDSKATEALTKAIESLTIAQEAITTATTLGNEAKADAQNALEQANSAHDTAGEALMEATDALTKAEQAITTATTLGNEAKTDAQQAINTATTLGNEAKAQAQQAIATANEALSQVVQGLGTKVYDNHGNLLAGAKFTGHNGINVDMDETDPETFNIRLDNEVVGQLEEMQSKIASNEANITAHTNQITTLNSQLEMTDGLIETIENEINNSIKPRLTSVESTASANASDLAGVHNTLYTQDVQITVLKNLTKYFALEDDNEYFNFLLGDDWRLRVNKTDYYIYLQYKAQNTWHDALGHGSEYPQMNGENMVDWIGSYNATANPPKWIQLHSGIIIQFFTFDVSGTTWVTLPKAMTTTTYIVAECQQYISNYDWNKTTLMSKETSRFKMRNDAYKLRKNFIVIGK